MNPKLPIILDTDIFGDSDDLLALMYLLTHQDVLEIKLIVTADEHKGMRAAWLQSLLKQAGYTIPVVAGKDLGNTRLFLFEEISTNTVEFEYVSAIKDVVQAHEELTYSCMAPHSNLAEFISQYPELGTRLKVVAMGAVLDLDLGRLEHNLKTDISAFQLVVETTSPTLLLADHTWHKSMRFSRTSELYLSLLNNTHPFAKAVIKNANLFFDRLYPESRFHDPILASTLFTDFVRFTPEKIVIEDSGVSRRAREEHHEKGTQVMVSSGVEYELLYQDLFRSIQQVVG